MKKPPGYWWACLQCDYMATFLLTTQDKHIGYFLHDRLIPEDWKQDLLAQPCPACETSSLRIAFSFRGLKPTEQEGRVFVEEHHRKNEVILSLPASLQLY